METSPETRIESVDTIFDPKGCQIRFSGVILGQVSALRNFFGTQFFWLFGSSLGRNNDRFVSPSCAREEMAKLTRRRAIYYRPPNVLARRGELSAKEARPGGAMGRP